MSEKGRLFVISAPAGTGKSTLVEMLLREFPDTIAESCSWTTRSPRPGEKEGKHYTFVTHEAFQKNVTKGAFLEYVEVFGHFYGTRKEEVERLQAAGKHVILVIDTQGAVQLMGQVEAVFIFIAPPSMEELKSRLLKRRTESEEKIEERLKWAEREMALAPRYDYDLVNDDLEETYKALVTIIQDANKRRTC